MKTPRALVLLLALAAPVAGQETYESSTYGFSLRPPAGWACYTGDGQDGVLHQVAVYPRDAKDGLPSALLQVAKHDGRLSPAQVRDAAATAYAAKGAGAGALAAGAERDVAGRPAATLRGELALPGGGGARVECCYLVSDGFVYALTLSRRADDAAAARALDGLVASFTLRAADPRTARLRALADRCGTEVPWARTWADAAVRAARDDRLVLVLYRHYSVVEVPDALPSGALMDPDLVALLQERFVALRMDSGDEAPFRPADRFGLGPHTWGKAALIVTPGGEVVTHTGVLEASHLYHLALQALERAAPATAAVASGDVEADAALALRRGDLARVEALLAGRETPRAHALRAALLRVRRRPVEALGALEAALRAGADPDLQRDLSADAAVLHLRRGDVASAERNLKALAAAAGERRGAEAMYWLGALAALRSGDLDGGGWWARLVEEAPEDRWAWKAAANLLRTGALVNGGELIAWPPEQVFAEARPGRATPAGGTGRPDDAEGAARAHLLRTQRDDGGWGHPIEDLSLTRVGYREAITAIAGASLLRFEDARPAVERALGFVLAARRDGRLERRATYVVWAQAFALRFLARCARAGVGPEGEVRAGVEALVAALVARQLASGGWPYVTSQTDRDGGGLATSFLGAAILLALVDAREVVAVPGEALERGEAFLRSLRDEDGSFRYAPDVKRAPGDAPEASGRSPLCALALHRVALARGEAGDLGGVRRALELLLRDRGRIRSERGKDLCHTGLEGQASYYLFYDYAFAFDAVRALPEGERARFADPLREDVLAARLADGSFVDMPSLGRAYATGMALECLAR